MNKVIKVIRFAGLTLADFRKLDKEGRSFLWLLAVTNYEWSKQMNDYVP